MGNKTKKRTLYFLLPHFILFFSCQEKKTNVKAENTSIEWRKKDWNFGNVIQGEEVAHTFHFRNTGQSNLFIKKIETGCGCTIANYDKVPVLPGKEGKIEITFNSKKWARFPDC